VKGGESWHREGWHVGKERGGDHCFVFSKVLHPLKSHHLKALGRGWVRTSTIPLREGKLQESVLLIDLQGGLEGFGGRKGKKRAPLRFPTRCSGRGNIKNRAARYSDDALCPVLEEGEG